jgi:hypothetical protein
MSRSDIAFWIVNGLLAVLMTLASIPDLLSVPQAVAVFERLGYPLYLLPFIGAAKLFGVVAILLRVPWRIKEWAYAGFAFDSLGAVYSHINVGDTLSQWWGALLSLILVAGAYILYCMRPQSNMVAARA